MKFSAEKTDLFEAVNNASKACAPKTALSALDGVLLTLRGNVLTVTGYDLEMGIKSIIECVGAEDGEIVLNAKIFGEMIRRMPQNAPVEITVSDDVKVQIKSGKVEYNIVGVSGNEFPNIPELNRQTSFTIKEATLKSMISQTFHAISQNDSKPVHMGSKFDIIENELNVVSTDGVRLAKRVEKISYQDLAFVIPQKTLSELVRILTDNCDNDITICIDKNQVCVSKDDYVIISRLLEGDFIDYKRIISFAPTFEATVNVREYAESLERTLLLITDRFKSPVVCTFEQDNLIVECKTNLGEVRDEMPVKFPYAKFEIAFNARYMLDALRNSCCDEVKLQFTAPLAPIKIVPLGDESFTFLVLPVRLK